jgi:Fe-S-cluster containining protein
MEHNFEKIINGMYIDPLIFTTKFVKACDVCLCSGECCYYGVYTDKADYEKILAEKDKIIKYMDDSQTKDSGKWFEEPEIDNDFPSGIAVGTEVHNGKCVFLDKQGFCTLQKMAMAQGEFKWKYKPLYCILFPLVIFEGVLTIDDEHIDRMHFCSKSQNQSSTVFDCTINELKHVLGEQGFEELVRYKDEYFEGLKQEESQVEPA